MQTPNNFSQLLVFLSVSALCVILIAWGGITRSTIRYTSPISLTVQSKLFPATDLGFEYEPSPLETTWSTHISKWSITDDEFCLRVNDFANESKYWIDITTKHINHKDDPVSQVVPTTSVFSSFLHKYSCGGQEQTLTTYIEPLAFALRYPLAPCHKGDDKLFSRDYLMLTSAAELHTLSCGQTDFRAFFFDLGASTWSKGAGGNSQNWFFNAYARRGIKFDRMLMWEVSNLNGADIMKEVPKEAYAAYQFFNVPASADPNDPSNPLNILKKITRPQDFVVLKVDIDNSPIETQFIRQIFEDDKVLQRVDEFFFEHHVNFNLMLQAGWGGGSYSKNETLHESYKLFGQLRSRGVRAHSWP